MGDFGWALEKLRGGQKVQREGWNGKGMWLALVANPGLHVHGFPHAPYVGMKTADDKFVPWLCSQTDLLAEDWQIVE